MNYQKIDAERIRKVKEAERENRVQNTWDALQYKSKALRTAKANRTTTQSHSPVISPSKEAKAKASSIIAGTNLSSNTTKKTNNSIPKLNGMKGDPRYEAPTRPATRYRNEPAVKYEPKTTPQRDTKYDKDFAEYWDARFVNHDVRDYDSATDRDVAHWENVKKDLMKKYNWSEKEFDEKFKPYNEEQWQKMSQEELSFNKSLAEKSAILGALGSTMYLPEAIGEGIAGSISRLVGYKNDEFAGNDDLLATRSREAMKTIGADKVKEKAKNKIENSLVGKIAGNAVGKDKVETVGDLVGGAASGLYNAGTGFADMAVASAVPGGIAWLGGDTAARSLLNSEERGIDERKAGLQALLSGGASAVINKVGLDKAMKGLPSLSALQNVRNAALTEAGENVLEDNVNTLLDTVLNGKKSELVTLHDYYMKQGMPSAQAWLNVAKDTGEDRIISALSGAAFGAFMSGAKNRKALVSEIEDRMQYNKRQNADIRGILGGNAAEVLARAKEAQQARLNEAAARITNTDVNPAPEAAQTPVPEAEITRPDVNSDLKQRQLDVINRTNPAPDDIHTWVRSVDDIKTFEEVWNENPNVDPDFTEEMAQEAMRTGKIKVYSSYNIEDGTFVTPSYMEALAYAGDPNNVKSAVVNLNDVAWIDTDQGQLARVNDVAPEGKITEGNVNSPQAETPQTPINRASEKNEGKIPSVDVISPSVEAAETAPKKVPSLKPNAEDIKLVRNKETGEHTYGDYRVVKNGKSGYTVVDADGNSIGDARILKDAKDVIANAEGERAAELEAIKQEYEGKNFGFGENIEDVPEEPATNGVLRPEDVKLTKNTTANGGTEYSYGDYRVTKNGRWYQIKDADGNLLGESRTLNDAKASIAAYETNATQAEAPVNVDDVPKELIDNTEQKVALNNTGIEQPSESNEAPEIKLVEKLPKGEGYTENGLSRVMTNSAINAEIIDRKMLDTNPELRQIATYERHNNESTFGKASENVRNRGDKLYQEYADGREVKSDQDVDECMIMAQNIKDQLTEATDPKTINDLTAKRNLLLSRLRKAGTEGGQLIQAFAKWNDTADGAMLNGERILNERTKQFASNNQDKVASNSRIAKSFAQMGDDTKPNYAERTPQSREKIREGVIKVLEKEYGSISEQFTENDIEYLTTLAENTDIPIWQIVDEIEHRMETGNWYTLDESIDVDRPINQRLQSALESMLERPSEGVKPEYTLEEIKEQVRNTLDREYAGEADFTDLDVDYIASLIKNGATTQDIADALNTKMATGTFGISAETQQMVNDLFKYAEYAGVNSKDGVDAKLQAYKLIANETVGKASGFEKFEAWRYLAMLGNTKTMVRNRVGNELFNILTGFSNNLSALAEIGTDYGIKGGKKALNKVFGTDFDTTKSINRTKTFLNPLALIESGIYTRSNEASDSKIGKKLGLKGVQNQKFNDSKLISAARADGKLNKWGEIAGENSKYEKSTRDKIKSQKSVFDSKLLQLYEKATDAGISDTSAVLRKYSTSLAGYLKANGYDASAFDAEARYRNLQAEMNHRMLTNSERAEMQDLKKTMDFLDKARDYALDQAEYATFHEDNKVASWLSNDIVGKARNSDSNVLNALGTMAEGIIPFKKTPANILRSGFEYSPFGALKSVKDTIQLVYENTGGRDKKLDETYERKKKFGKGTKQVNRVHAADVIDSWSKSLTGTGLAVLGYWLADKGVLHSSKGGEKYQDQLEGKQNYAININGHSYTLDWAAPASMPLLIGAEWQKITQDNGISSSNWIDNIDEAVGTLNALLDPVVETSMMQGVQNSLESAANQIRNEDNSVTGKGMGVMGALASGALTNYFTQGIPTAAGQIARTVDPIRRSTDTATDSNFIGEFERTMRKTMNKLPFVSMLNQPYIDAKGRQQKNSPFDNQIGNFAYQALSPSYYADIDVSDADQMARDIYNGKDDKGNPIMDSKVFAPWKSTVRVNGKKLNPEQMADYRERSGKAGDEIRTSLAHADWFNALTDSQKKSIVTNINTLVDKIGKQPYDSTVTGDDLDAYNESGVEGVMEYYKVKAVKKSVENQTGLSQSSNALKDITNDILNGDMESANQKIAEEAQKKAALEPYEAPAEELGIDARDYSNIKTYAGDSWSKVEPELPKLKGMGVTNYSQYAHAVKYAESNPKEGSIDPQWFAQQTKLLDTDKSGGISQDELVNHFNEKNMSQDEVMRLWNMLALGKDGAEPKSVPHIITKGENKGKWGL